MVEFVRVHVCVQGIDVKNVPEKNKKTLKNVKNVTKI